MINCIIVCCTIIFICIYGLNRFKNIVMLKKYNYKEILELFDYFLSKSYDTLYETDLITYITNNVSMSPEERETCERNYIKRCLMYMGNTNKKMFIHFFGDTSTMYVNMIRYVRKRLNEDALTKIIQDKANQEQQESK